MMATDRLSYNVAEAAAATGFSVAFISGEIKAGRLKAKTPKARTADSARNSKRVIRAAELERFIEEMADAV